MVDNSLNKSKDILKKIEDIMKCEICNAKYDYNIHKPMVIKCGHSFCKYCLFNSIDKNLNNNNDFRTKKIFKCPIDGVQHFFNLDKNYNINEPGIYQNLKLEIILKEILNIAEPTIKEKYIVYSKPDMKRNKSPENSAKNTINNNSEGNLVDSRNNNRENSNKIKNRNDSHNKKNNINIKINSGNQIINVNAINVNIDTRDIIKKGENNKKISSSNIKSNINNIKNNCNNNNINNNNINNNSE